VSAHELICPLLAESAAGLLDAVQERAVREHARECPECAAELMSLAAAAQAIGLMPCPAPPPDLLSRTQARIAADRERREAQRLALAGALCAAGMAVSACVLLQPVFGPMVWLAATLVPMLPAAAAAAILAGRRVAGSAQ
jgi:hypothetical protein